MYLWLNLILNFIKVFTFELDEFRKHIFAAIKEFILKNQL